MSLKTFNAILLSGKVKGRYLRCFYFLIYNQSAPVYNVLIMMGELKSKSFMCFCIKK